MGNTSQSDHCSEFDHEELSLWNVVRFLFIPSDTSAFYSLPTELLLHIAQDYINLHPLLILALGLPEKVQSLDKKTFGSPSDKIRAALSDPSPYREKEAWAAISASIDFEFSWYTFVQHLRACTEEFLLSVPIGDGAPGDSSFFFTLAEIWRFVLEADARRMFLPCINSDFSYYRRVAARKKNIPYGDATLNKLALFFAHPTPHLLETLSAPGWEKEEVLQYLIRKLDFLANKKKWTRRQYFFAVMGLMILERKKEEVWTKNSPIPTLRLLKKMAKYPEEIGFEVLKWWPLNLHNKESLPVFRKFLQQ
jgi:hypothetical protein